MFYNLSSTFLQKSKDNFCKTFLTEYSNDKFLQLNFSDKSLRTLGNNFNFNYYWLKYVYEIIH
jgi:hypothetical protein